jgi:hypothetical protein
MKNLLSENMMRFGTKNLSEAAQKELTLKSILETIDQYGLQREVRKALAEQADPNLGLAQKIVGMIWTAMSGMGTDEQKILKAVLMIKTKDIYNSVLKIVKTSPKIKAEFGQNYANVGDWISTDMGSYADTDVMSLDKTSNEIAGKITTHLQRISGDTSEGINSAGMGATIDKTLYNLRYGK